MLDWSKEGASSFRKFNGIKHELYYSNRILLHSLQIIHFLLAVSNKSVLQFYTKRTWSITDLPSSVRPSISDVIVAGVLYENQNIDRDIALAISSANVIYKRLQVLSTTTGYIFRKCYLN